MVSYYKNRKKYAKALVYLLQCRKKLYLTPVKTQLLQYNLTRDLMLFYHSYKIEA